jgi:hypothetical protein
MSFIYLFRTSHAASQPGLIHPNCSPLCDRMRPHPTHVSTKQPANSIVHLSNATQPNPIVPLYKASPSQSPLYHSILTAIVPLHKATPPHSFFYTSIGHLNRSILHEANPMYRFVQLAISRILTTPHELAATMRRPSSRDVTQLLYKLNSSISRVINRANKTKSMFEGVDIYRADR